jgi:hypothetical protein
MKTSLKKACIYSLAAGLGKMVMNQIHKFDLMDEEKKKLVIWNANQIAIEGEKALKYCTVKLDGSMLNRASKKITEAAIVQHDNSFEILEVLSFLFLGLNDLSSDKNAKAVEDAVLNFMTIYDPNLENESLHQIALKKYERWTR